MRRKVQISAEKKETISIGLYPWTIRLLGEACKKERLSISNLVEMVLLRSLEEEEGRPPSTPMAR